MGKKIVIIANNSGGLYGFRNELITELVERGDRITALTPFDTNVDDLRGLGIDLIEKFGEPGDFHEHQAAAEIYETA